MTGGSGGNEISVAGHQALLKFLIQGTAVIPVVLGGQSGLGQPFAQQFIIVAQRNNGRGQLVVGKGGEEIELVEARVAQQLGQFRQGIGETLQGMTAEFPPAAASLFRRQGGDVGHAEMVIGATEKILEAQAVFDAEDQRPARGEFAARLPEKSALPFLWVGLILESPGPFQNADGTNRLEPGGEISLEIIRLNEREMGGDPVLLGGDPDEAEAFGHGLERHHGSPAGEGAGDLPPAGADIQHRTGAGRQHRIEKSRAAGIGDYAVKSDTSVKTSVKNKVINACLKYDVKVLTVPPASKWINGELSVNQIRQVRIEELLEREPIRLDKEIIETQTKGKRILVTGAAGSIGQEIVRQLAKYNPSLLICLDQAESPLHELDLELQHDFPNLKFEIVLGDIRVHERMEKVFQLLKPELVYHAAAYKHVPLMENNPSESILTNVLGTKNCADLAVKYGVISASVTVIGPPVSIC